MFQENGRHIQITQVAEGGYFLCLRKDAEYRQFFFFFSVMNVDSFMSVTQNGL